MNIQVFETASFAVQVHLVSVLFVIGLTVFLLTRRKGDPLHRALGRIWMLLMLVTALASLFIHELNPPRGFSVIHILSIVAIISVILAWRAARRHDVRGHKRIVFGLVFGALVIAGAFALSPDRLTYQLFFG